MHAIVCLCNLSIIIAEQYTIVEIVEIVCILFTISVTNGICIITCFFLFFCNYV